MFLVLCGFFPKLATIIQIMPQCVPGGAAVMMFASNIVSGIQLIVKEGLTSSYCYDCGGFTRSWVREFRSTANVLSKLPPFVGYILGGSGIVPAALCALILNIVIRDDEIPNL